jgi:hypothetical protein
MNQSMINDDLRQANWRRATEGARKTLGKPEPKLLERLRRPEWRDVAIRQLRDLRADVAAGLPAAALLDRIDDALFRLKSGKKP